MKNKLILLVLFLLIVPHFVFASWWNPISWFKKTPVPVVRVITPIPPPIVPKIVPKKVIKKIVTKPSIVVSPTSTTVPTTQSIQQSIPQQLNIDSQPQQISQEQYDTQKILDEQKAQFELQQQAIEQFLEKEKQIKEEIDTQTKPFYDQLDQMKPEETKCLAVAGTFTSGQLTAECTQNSITEQSILNKIIAITSIYAIPTAICGDFTYSYSKNREGTCSYHGGVLDWYP